MNDATSQCDSKIAVLGGGAWGTALACATIRTGSETTLYVRDAETAAEIGGKHRNGRYLGDIALEPGILATSNLSDALAQVGIVLLAVPAQQLAGFAPQLFGHLNPEAMIVNCAKGIDRQSGLLPHQILRSLFGTDRLASLSGPSFATDVANGLPTAVTIAADSLELAQMLSRGLSSPRFRCYASDDLAGVELGGALKNVLALAVGAARGLRLGASAEAALIARGFAEMRRLATALGARPETLMGLSGLGDLVLTCSSVQSRNFAYGVALGTGAPREGLKLAEGVHTAQIAAELAVRAGVEAPVTQAVADVLAGNLNAAQAVTRLLDRPLRDE